MKLGKTDESSSSRSGHMTQAWLVGVDQSAHQSHFSGMKWLPTQVSTMPLSSGALFRKIGEEKLLL